ncbi:MAG TPA: glutaredoxin family protein [Candidatus Binatia bacterium]
MAVTIYTRGDCEFSRRLRESFRERGIAFREIDVGANPECIPELVKLTGRRRIVPVVVDGAKIEIAPQGGTEF